MVETNPVAAMLSPKLDTETIAAVQQRNLEALSALGACLATGAQNLFKRQSELMQTCLSDQLAAAKDMFSGSSTPQGFSRQLAFAQAQAKKALADTEELAGIVSATATDALEILCRTTQASVSEIYSNGHGTNGNGARAMRSAAKPG